MQSVEPVLENAIKTLQKVVDVRGMGKKWGPSWLLLHVHTQITDFMNELPTACEQRVRTECVAAPPSLNPMKKLVSCEFVYVVKIC